MEFLRKRLEQEKEEEAEKFESSKKHLERKVRDTLGGIIYIKI